MTTGLRNRLYEVRRNGSAPLFLAIAINAFGAGMFVPFALIYYQTVTDLSAGTIGLMLTIATCVTLLVTPVTGILVDRFGARSLVICSQGIEAIGFIGYLTVSSELSLLGAALIATSGTRMFYASFSTLIAESTEGPEQDRWYGLIGITQTLGASLSGFIASILIGSLGVTGFRAIIAGTACCLIASGLLITAYRPQRTKREPETQTDGYLLVLRDRVFLRIVTSNMVFVLYSMLIGIGFAVYVTSALQAPLWSVGAIGVVQTGLVVGFQTRITKMLQDRRRTRSMLFAGCISTITCLLLAFGLQIPQHLIVLYLLGVGIIFTSSQMLYIPASRALASELSSPQSRGRYIALFELSYGVAAAIAPAFFGIAFDTGARMPWMYMGLLLLGAMLILRQAESAIPLARNRPIGGG